MMLPRLIDIASRNVDSYFERYERKTDEEKRKVTELHNSMSVCVNMEIDTLHRLFVSHYKNRFEICAEHLGMSLDEFCRLPIAQQTEYVCAHMRSEYHYYGIRRVDFSNRYDQGLQMYYLAVNMGISAGNSKYGRCCVTVSSFSTPTDVMLKYDSLKHYYDDDNEFDDNAFHKDLIPNNHAELMLADKFSDQLAICNVEEIKQSIENDPDPIEIITTTKISGVSISTVVMSSGEYRHIVIELNRKKALGEILELIEEEDLQNFMRLQMELRRRRIILRIV